MRVEARFVGNDFVLHELGRRLSEQPLLVGQLVAREHVVGDQRPGEKRPATHAVLNLRHFCSPQGSRVPRFQGSKSSRSSRRSANSVRTLRTLEPWNLGTLNLS